MIVNLATGSPDEVVSELQKLVAPVGFEGPWQEVGRAIDVLLARTIVGKAVLHVERPDPTSL